jgi:hypothetical protein
VAAVAVAAVLLALLVWRPWSAVTETPGTTVPRPAQSAGANPG